MSAQHPTDNSSSDAAADQAFLNLFMVVIGALVAVAIVLVFLARSIASDSQLAWVKQDPDYTSGVEERIKPVAAVRLPGEAAPEAAAPDAAGAVAATTDAAAPVAAKMTGEQVYNAACFACHGAGVGGAPKLGDAGAWAPRIAQGQATLIKHALEGFQGKAGVMPPKGGRVDLSDDEIIAAVKFLSGT